MRSDSMILYPTLFQSFTIYFREREREKEGWGVVSQKKGCCVG